MGLWDHTALALVIIIDINSGERSWTLVICRPFQRQPWALSIRGASLSSPLLELMLWRLQGRTASLMRVLAQQTCHSNTALLFLRHAQWLTPPNINVSCLLSLSPSFLPSLSRHICSQDILSPFIFRFASHFCHGKAVIESLLVHIIAFSPSRPDSLSELTLISVCCPTSSFWSLSPFTLTSPSLFSVFLFFPLVPVDSSLFWQQTLLFPTTIVLYATRNSLLTHQLLLGDEGWVSQLILVCFTFFLWLPRPMGKKYIANFKMSSRPILWPCALWECVCGCLAW